jgi:hypothetical protein
LLEDAREQEKPMRRRLSSAAASFDRALLGRYLGRYAFRMQAIQPTVRRSLREFPVGFRAAAERLPAKERPKNNFPLL